MAEEAKDAGVPYTGPPVGSSGPYTGLGAAAAAADADGEGSDMDRDDRDTLEMTPFQKNHKSVKCCILYELCHCSPRKSRRRIIHSSSKGN